MSFTQATHSNGPSGTIKVILMFQSTSKLRNTFMTWVEHFHGTFTGIEF